MWWCSCVQGLQQVGQKSGILLQNHVLAPGPLADSRGQTDLQDVLQDVTLLCCLVDADGAASDLTAVQHQVVMLAPHLNGTQRSHDAPAAQRDEEGVATFCGSVYSRWASSGRAAVNGWWADSSFSGSSSPARNRGKSTTHRK